MKGSQVEAASTSLATIAPWIALGWSFRSCTSSRNTIGREKARREKFGPGPGAECNRLAFEVRRALNTRTLTRATMPQLVDSTIEPTTLTFWFPERPM